MKKKRDSEELFICRLLFLIISFMCFCFFPRLKVLCEEKDETPPEIKVEITDADKEFTRDVRKATVIITDNKMKGSINKEYVFKEGKDSFHITVKDAAGNESTYMSDVYIQDYTPPELNVSGIRDSQIVNGEFNVSIQALDEWLDKEKSYVLIKGRKSLKNYEYFFDESAVINICDDASLPDDYYTMRVILSDRAGNMSESEISFTINKNGSEFEVDDKNREILGLYTKEVKDFCISEKNLSRVEDSRILFALNVRVIDLKEGTDYLIKETKDMEGYTYTYIFNDELFIKDGIYTISVKTKDEAGNVNDTRLNKETDEIRFAVKKEDQASYNKK